MVFVDWFDPGYKAGGIIRSSVNFSRMMSGEYCVFVITRDRDLNDTQPYDNIKTDSWIDFENGIKIYYCSPGALTKKNLQQQLNAVQPDYLYLNSMFSLYFTVFPLLMKKPVGCKMILVPRGMLRTSALQFKPGKKKLFLAVLRLFRINKRVHFHATDKTELDDIRRQFGENTSVTLLEDAYPPLSHPPDAKPAKSAGEISMIFVGRIHPIKNLDYLLKLLPLVNGKLSLTVVGSEEDQAYVQQCKAICKGFPGNIQVTFSGEVPNNKLDKHIDSHHIFALPTQGENFGHAIFEALAQATPVLISDQTPWRNLEKQKAGWDIALKNESRFLSALQQAINFDQVEYDLWSASARKYVEHFIESTDIRSGYYKLFS
jgi:glycosyltransferase involved in cell wall biosynthesis